jgi:hypothetical protein
LIENLSLEVRPTDKQIMILHSDNQLNQELLPKQKEPLQENLKAV